MIGRGSRLEAARLLCAAAVLAFVPAATLAQTPPPTPPPLSPDPAELDPSAPLDPLPGLGVAWPDLKATESAPPPDAPAPASAKKNAKREPAVDAGNIRYAVQVDGLSPIGNAQELLRQFRRQSALQAEHKD